MLPTQRVTIKQNRRGSCWAGVRIGGAHMAQSEPREAKAGFELHSGYILRKCLCINGAGEGNRTLVSGLGSPHSTIEPHPLSCFQPNRSLFLDKFDFAIWRCAAPGLNLLVSIAAAACPPAFPILPRAALTPANAVARSFAAWLAGRAARALPAISPRRERHA